MTNLEPAQRDDTLPSTPYPFEAPTSPYAPPQSVETPRAPASASWFGDRAGEHLRMKRGRFSAWPHVVLAFVTQAALAGLVAAAAPWIVARLVFSTEVADVVGLVVAAGAGLAAAHLTFRDRWRCTEAFASRFCVGLLNLSVLYVPIVALVYANVRAAQRLAGR